MSSLLQGSLRIDSDRDVTISSNQELILLGTASTSLNAQTVKITPSYVNRDHYINFSASTNYDYLNTDNQLLYNPATHTLDVTNLTADSTILSNLTVTNLNATTATIGTANITTENVQTSNITNLTVTNLNAVSATIPTLNSTTITATTINGLRPGIDQIISDGSNDTQERLITFTDIIGVSTLKADSDLLNYNPSQNRITTGSYKTSKFGNNNDATTRTELYPNNLALGRGDSYFTHTSNDDQIDRSNLIIRESFQGDTNNFIGRFSNFSASGNVMCTSTDNAGTRVYVKRTAKPNLYSNSSEFPISYQSITPSTVQFVSFNSDGTAMLAGNDYYTRASNESNYNLIQSTICTFTFDKCGINEYGDLIVFSSVTAHTMYFYKIIGGIWTLFYTLERGQDNQRTDAYRDFTNAWVMHGYNLVIANSKGNPIYRGSPQPGCAYGVNVDVPSGTVFCPTQPDIFVSTGGIFYYGTQIAYNGGDLVCMAPLYNAPAGIDTTILRYISGVWTVTQTIARIGPAPMINPIMTWINPLNPVTAPTRLFYTWFPSTNVIYRVFDTTSGLFQPQQNKSLPYNTYSTTDVRIATDSTSNNMALSIFTDETNKGIVMQSTTNGGSDTISFDYSKLSINGSLLFNKTIISPFFDQPGGRISCTQNPFDPNDVTSSTLYYVPFINNKITLWNGYGWETRKFSTLSLGVSGLIADSSYDVYVFIDTNNQLSLLTFQWTNSITRAVENYKYEGALVRADETKYLYVGSIYFRTAGVLLDNSRERYIWNYYNRVEKNMKYQRTGLWSLTTTNTIRPVANDFDGCFRFIQGYTEDRVIATIGVGELVMGGGNSGCVGFSINNFSTLYTAGMLGATYPPEYESMVWKTIAFNDFMNRYGLNYLIWMEKITDTGVQWGSTGDGVAAMLGSARF